MFGQRGRLGTHLSELLSEGGAFHFLAISGLHVGIFAAFVWAALNWLPVPIRLRTVVLIVMIWLYALFTGLHISAVRAALMLSFILAAPLFERRHDSVHALVAAALLILLIWPQQLFTAGFQLTFLAVWAVIYLYAELARILWPWDELVMRTQRPSERSLWSELSFHARHYLLLSASVWLAVAPVTAHHFHHFSFLTPLINLILWPLVLPLIVCSFLLTLSVPLGGPLPYALARAADFLSLRIEGLLEMAAGLPGFVVRTGAHPVWWTGLFYAVLAVWVVRARVKRGRTAFILGVLVLVAAHVWIDIGARSSDGLTLTVAEVGHGQCVVFRLPSGAVMLYDAGGRRPGRAAAVEGILRQGRARRIQKLMLTHRDFDHCSFVPSLAHRFTIGEVLIPPNTSPRASVPIDGELRRLGLTRTPFLEGARLWGEGLECAALHPNDRFLGDPRLSENEKSLVLLCCFGGCRILLTGDIEEDALGRLAADYGEALRADVLLLPHHGAMENGLREFIDLVRPRIALASCGAEASGEVREMLKDMGIPLWTTAEHGALIVEVGTGGLSVTGFRSGRRERLAPAEPSVLE